MKTIKINFTGLSIRTTFDPNNNPILDILKKHYDVVVCDDPDYVICGMLDPGGYYSNGIYEKFILNYPCIRIMIEGENFVPDYNLVDYSICPYPIHYLDRNFYLPCGIEALTSGVSSLLKVQNKKRDYSSDFLESKQYFASFIESHDSENNIRSTFFHALNARKRVESAGSYLNNMENGLHVNWLDGSKIEFQKKCKFSLCIEPLKHDGWIAERIVEGFDCDTIPIYYGSPNIKEIFNPKAFINISDYPDFDSVIDRILEIDQNDELYMEMLRQPIFNDSNYASKLMDSLEAFLCHIFDQPLNKAWRRSKVYSPKNHEDFLKRSIIRAEKLDIEGIRPKSDREIAWKYFRSIPRRIVRKLIGRKHK